MTAKAFNSFDPHQERVVQQHIVAQLVGSQGYVEHDTDDYSGTLAMGRK